MDLLNLGYRSLESGDVKSSKEDILQDLEYPDTPEANDGVRDRRRSKLTREKSRDGASRTISLDEVAWHDAPDDCWLVIYDHVYDCTEFLRNHPGGQDVLVEYAGRDATLAFIGTGHSAVATTNLDRYKIGELPPEERIFRVPGGVNVLGF